MTIAHVVECFNGGVYRFLLEMAANLPQHAHVIICGNRSHPSEIALKKDFPGNVSFINWEYAQREISPISDIKALLSLKRILRNINFDVLHLHSAKAGFIGRIAAKLLGHQAVAYTTHAAPFLRKDVPLKTERAFLILERMASKLPGTIVCCSRSEAVEVSRRGIPCIYISNGTKIEPAADEPIPSLPLQVVTCGRITEQKGPRIFNEIAKQLENEGDAIKFTWIGEGDMMPALTAENIMVTGWLSSEMTSSALDKADIYLSTSKWEGLPMAVLEAMSKGKTLLLSNCIGNVDLVQEGRNGSLFNTTEEAVQTLETYIKDPAILKEKGRRSREMCASEFDIKETCKKYDDLYLKLTSHG